MDMFASSPLLSSLDNSKRNINKEKISVLNNQIPIDDQSHVLVKKLIIQGGNRILAIQQ